MKTDLDLFLFRRPDLAMTTPRRSPRYKKWLLQRSPGKTDPHHIFGSTLAIKSSDLLLIAVTRQEHEKIQHEKTTPDQSIEAFRNLLAYTAYLEEAIQFSTKVEIVISLADSTKNVDSLEAGRGPLLDEGKENSARGMAKMISGRQARGKILSLPPSVRSRKCPRWTIIASRLKGKRITMQIERFSGKKRRPNSATISQGS